MSYFMIWLHVMGIIITLGAALLLVLAVYPAANKINDGEQRFQMLAGVLKYFHPLYLFGICLVFMTGAIGLTDLKINLGLNYYDQVGNILIKKFALTMLIFLVASMQCFGQGLKVTRMANGVIEADLATKQRYLKKIYRATLTNIVLIAVALYIGLQLPAAIAH